MEAQCGRMLRLVQADVTSARKRDLTNRAPSGFLHIRAGDTLLGEGRHLGPQVFAHEIQLMHVVLLRRMERGFRRRHCEDQPAVAGVHGRESKDVSEESAVSLRVPAVDDHMSATDHRLCPSFFRLRLVLLQSPNSRTVGTDVSAGSLLPAQCIPATLKRMSWRGRVARSTASAAGTRMARLSPRPTGSRGAGERPSSICQVATRTPPGAVGSDATSVTSGSRPARVWSASGYGRAMVARVLARELAAPAARGTIGTASIDAGFGLGPATGRSTPTGAVLAAVRPS